MKQIFSLVLLFATISFASCSKNDDSLTPVSGVTLNKTTLTLEVGKTETLTATIAPSSTSDPSVTWSSSDPTVASVSSAGLVTALKKGSATITVTSVADNSKKATCTLTVNDAIIAVTGVTLNKTTLTLEVGKTETLTATITPENATDKSVTWTSSDPTVASVSSAGLVTALKKGSATITVTSVADNTKKATCTLTVNDAIIAVTGVTLNKTTLTLEVGKTETLTATITPENATDKSVTWTSSAPTVASVSSAGLVTALKKGSATITATSVADNTKKATCALTVNTPAAVVGNYFYSDGSYSATLDTQKSCIGIVFWVNPTDATKGKIVSLDQTAQPIYWSTETVVTGITNGIDGAANTRNMVALSTYTPAKYPAFAWCVAKNTPATAGISWYLPANQELRQLFAAIHGLKWLASGTAADGEIADWGDRVIMPEAKQNPTACAAFNNYLTTASGTPFDFTGDSSLWSSAESGQIEGYRIGLHWGATNSMKKDYVKFNVRAVSAF